MKSILLGLGLLVLEFLFAVAIVWLGEQRCRRRQAREEAKRATELVRGLYL